jgi:SAM-dependent methyltransferase
LASRERCGRDLAATGSYRDSQRYLGDIILANSESTFECRACGTIDRHETVLSLGSLPLGNCLLTRGQLAAPEARYAIDFAMCETCSLLQVREPLPADQLSAEIHYFSSVSPTLLAHGRRLAGELRSRLAKRGDALVVEIGSNDGALLAAVRELGATVLGIEPIAASAELARHERNVSTIVELFSADLARRLCANGHRADVIIANYVLELVADLHDFIEGLRLLLALTGTIILEVPYVRSMAEQLRFDALAHLRSSWFSVTSLDHLLRKHGLILCDAEYLPRFRGGTLRVYATHRDHAAPAACVQMLLDDERAAGLTGIAFYRAFAGQVHTASDALRDFLVRQKVEGRRIAGYGAGIKAATLLNFTGIGTDLIDFTVDCNPHKQGRYLPGSHIPVRPPEALLTEAPDFTLMLALDFVHEVLAQQEAYRSRGGKFVLPAPVVVII